MASPVPSVPLMSSSASDNNINTKANKDVELVKDMVTMRFVGTLENTDSEGIQLLVLYALTHATHKHTQTHTTQQNQHQSLHVML